MWPFKKMDKRTSKKRTIGYTFKKEDKCAVVTFTKPGDSGRQMYFFENKELADKSLPAFSDFAPGLADATVVKCTLEEIQLEAQKCGASIEAYSIVGKNIIIRRY